MIVTKDSVSKLYEVVNPKTSSFTPSGLNPKSNKHKNIYNSFVTSKPPKFCDLRIFFLMKFCLLLFQLLKTSFNWEIFCWLTNKKFIFSAKSKHKKLTADIWLKKYLVIHEILVVRIPRTCYKLLIFGNSWNHVV